MFHTSVLCIVLILLFVSRIIFSIPMHEDHSDQLTSMLASSEQDDYSEELPSTSTIVHTSPIPEDLTTELQNILVCETIEQQAECVAFLERHLSKGSEEYRQLQNLKDYDRLTDTTLPRSAAYRGYIELVEALLHNGLPVNKKYTSLEETVLHVAAESGHDDLITFLLKQGADINVKDKQGDTPLHESVSHFHSTAVKLLLDAGADVNATNEKGETSLLIAVAAFNPLVLLMNLLFASSRSEVKKRGCVDDKRIIEMLLEHRADTNIPDNVGITPLHIAASNCDSTIVKLLIDGGANINATDVNNQTPLHVATESNNVSAVDYLVAMGCDKTIIDKKGKTALDLAKEGNFAEIVNLLSRKSL